MSFPTFRVSACVALATLVAGCAVDRPSILDDRGPIQTSLQDHFKVAVVAVDGVPRGPGLVSISPGRHDVTFAARPDSGVALPATQTIAMSIIPCTQYRMVARPGPASAQDWTVLIEGSAPTSDCAGSSGNFATQSGYSLNANASDKN